MNKQAGFGYGAWARKDTFKGRETSSGNRRWQASNKIKEKGGGGRKRQPKVAERGKRW